MTHKNIKILTKLLLWGYLFGLVWFFVIDAPSENVRIIDFLIKEYAVSDSCKEYFVNMSRLMLIFGIVGFLYPFSSGKKNNNRTYKYGILIIFLFEIIRLLKIGGTVCIDEVIFCFFGIAIGQKLFTLVCSKSRKLTYYLWPAAKKKSGWVVSLCIVCLLILAISKSNLVLSKSHAPLFEDGYNIDEEKILALFDSADGASSAKEDIRSLVDAGMADIINGTYVPDDDRMYDAIYDSIKEYGDTITITGITVDTDKVHETLLEVLNDHPEIFWLTGGGKGTLMTMGYNQIYTYMPSCFVEKNQIANYSDKLNHAVDEIVTACPSGSEYDKALWVHDYLVNSIDYDMNVYFSSTYSDSTKYDLAYTSYGAIINHKAVCAGYAKAYQMIMQRLGIECGYVTGIGRNAMGDGPHAWNYINIEGTYYFVDVTWDDPVSIGYSSNNITHDYFCITKEELLRDHTIDPGQNLPLTFPMMRY